MGLVPGHDGSWTQASLAYVRVVARLRDRGHTLEQIRRASESGQLISGPIETLLKSTGPGTRSSRPRGRAASKRR